MLSTQANEAELHLFKAFLITVAIVMLAPQCHPTVADRLHSKFQSWLKNWIKSNVTNEQEEWCQDWLLGKVDGLQACTTTSRHTVTNAVIKHCKYSVKWEKDHANAQQVENKERQGMES